MPRYATDEERKAARKAAVDRYNQSEKGRLKNEQIKRERKASGVQSVYAKAHYQANKAEYIERAKKRREEHGRDKLSKKQKTTNRDNFLRRKFGISVAEYDALLVAQNGVCAICRETCSSGRRLAVDHCHRTGKVRGLLCTLCNTAIGLTKESVLRLRALIDYVEKHNGA